MYVYSGTDPLIRPPTGQNIKCGHLNGVFLQENVWQDILQSQKKAL